MATNYKEKLGNEVPARLSGRGQNPDEDEVKYLRGYLAVGQNPDENEVKCLRGYLAVGHNVPEGGEMTNPTARSSKSCVAWGKVMSLPPWAPKGANICHFDLFLLPLQEKQ